VQAKASSEACTFRLNPVLVRADKRSTPIFSHWLLTVSIV
jgi:hypothetical protein